MCHRFGQIYVGINAGVGWGRSNWDGAPRVPEFDVTGGVIGLAGGPIGAAIGAVGGAIVGAAAERMMHADDTDSHPHTSESLSPESVSGPTAAEARASDMPSRTVEDTPTDRETP